MIEPQAKLAQKICELSGYDGAIFFANSGAEANEGAIKLQESMERSILIRRDIRL